MSRSSQPADSALAEDVAAVMNRGAVAAQIGTGLLLSDEAGTNAAHRAALRHPEFVKTVVTRAFSGRYARGLENEFTRLFDEIAPLGYPEVNEMTSPIRSRGAVEDPHGTNLWAGKAYREACTGPAKDIVTALAPYIR